MLVGDLESVTSPSTDGVRRYAQMLCKSGTRPASFAEIQIQLVSHNHKYLEKGIECLLSL